MYLFGQGVSGHSFIPEMDDIHDWIQSTYSVDIKDPKFEGYRDFLLLWSILEGDLFQTDFKRNLNYKVKLVRYDEHILDSTIQFFRDRYISPDHNINSKFNSLKIRNERDKKKIEAVLLGIEKSETERVKACLYIIYRLRCHLFHGVKGIISMDDQYETFRKSIAFLLSCLQLSKNN